MKYPSKHGVLKVVCEKMHIWLLGSWTSGFRCWKTCCDTNQPIPEVEQFVDVVWYISYRCQLFLDRVSVWFTSTGIAADR